MRIRAIFCLLGCTCLGILGFAAIIWPPVSAIVQTQLDIKR